MRADRIVGRILIEDFALAGGAGGLVHGVLGRAGPGGRIKVDPVSSARDGVKGVMVAHASS